MVICKNLPEILIKEWDYTKNNIDINSVTSGLNKKAWWICSKNNQHKWEAAISNRAKRQSKCPYCTNKKACFENCLETLFPNIAKEWDYTKNNNLKPNQVLSKSSKKIWWICDKKHEYCSRVSDRIQNESGCPFCSNRKVNLDNCLLNNYPEIAKEFHPVLNNLTADDFVWGSHAKVWWQCSINNEHEWFAEINSRTSNGKGCPYCNSNKNEIIVGKILEQFYNKKNINNQYCINVQIYNNFGIKIRDKIRVDYVVLKDNLFIEYNGRQHYEPVDYGKLEQKTANEIFINQQIRDAWLRKYCKENKIYLIEIDGRKFKHKNLEKYLISVLEQIKCKTAIKCM